MNAVPSVRILIADDHPAMREGLTALLTHGSLCVIAQARNGKEAIALYRQHLPDVAVLDVRMPHMNGIDSLRCIFTEFPYANVVMLSAYDEEETVYQALQAGAKSYLLKDATPNQLRLAVSEAAQGKRYLTPRIADLLLRRTQSKPLTARELDVLQAMVQGKSNAEISRALCIAEGTVKAHVNNILAKMGVGDRTQAVTAALKRGLAILDASD